MGRLSEAEFTTIKELLAKGHDGKRVAEIIGRGAGTVSTVKNSPSYKDYKSRVVRVRPKVEPKQLPLDTPKKTTLDLREDIAIKVNALRDAIALYKSTSTGNNAVKQMRYCQKAQERIEEAWLWLKEGF